MPFDRSDQPADVAAQSPSGEIIIPVNGSEVTDTNTSNSVTVVNKSDEELEEARRAVTQLSVDHTMWLHRSRDLVSSLLKRFQETSQKILLAECINVQRQICAACTPSNVDRALAVSDLASSLRTLFGQTGEECLLSEAVDLNREALSLRPSGDPDRSASCNNLAITLCTCYWKTGSKSLLDEAMDLSREALSLCPIGHLERSMLCNSRAIILKTCFEQTGEESLLVEAIDLHREALSLRSNSHPERSKSCNNLATSLRTRFNETGEESLLAEAIELYREALSLRPSGHPERPLSCNNLASSLWACFTQTGEESLLAEAIDLHREALSLGPIGHPLWSDWCNNLAVSLWTRFNQTGEESLLTESIQLHREALSLQPGGHPGRHALCGNLATSLYILFHQTGEESVLTEAINLNREALYLRPSGHPFRSHSCSNLALSLYASFKQTRAESLLVEAIDLHREALSLQTSRNPDRLETCSRLVALLRTHFELTGDESQLVEAINLSKGSIETQSRHHPRLWDVMINLSYIYLNRRFSKHNTLLAIDYIQQALSRISLDWPTLLFEVAQLTSLIDLLILSGDSLSQLLQCFSAAIDLASRVAGFVLDPQSQLRYLSSSQHLGPRAYWCALACGQPQLGLELVERARAVIWTQALHMRNPQLRGAPPELASELEVLLSKMHALRVLDVPMSFSSHNQDIRHKNSERIHQLIQQIRALPGQERFMRGLPFDELAQCASHNAVVVLVATEGECHALILQPNSQEPITLKFSHITPNELTTMSIVAAAAQRRSATPNQFHGDYRGMKASPPQIIQHQTRSDPVLEKLWTSVVKPIIDNLGLQKSSGSSRPRLHWCPTGPFMFLPLHAAGIYVGNNTECCADYAVCSYTPTLTTLLHAQKSNPSFPRCDAKLGLIAAVNAWDSNLPALPNVEEEISNVRTAAERASVSIDDSGSCTGHAAVVAHVAEVFKSTNMTHIACHGKQNTTNALSSGFCLSDGDFSISRLMNLDLKDAFFAFLSACETAKGDEKQPDQTVHLAAAMLFVGFRSVVGTMWAMEDVDGPRVAKLFYERLFAGDVITVDTIPYALDYAVTELRNSGVSSRRWATFIHMGA